MLRRTVLGRRIDEFLLDSFIVCFSVGNLFPNYAPIAVIAFLFSVLCCISLDNSAEPSDPRRYVVRDSRRAVPIDFGKPG
jgi:hypothetical protein